MIKSIASGSAGAALLSGMQPLYKKLVKMVASIGNICLVSEDMLYKWHFIRYDMPLLYRNHTSCLYTNCAFCANLVRSGCHKHCLKCGAGTYIHCSPLLPGLLNAEAVRPCSTDCLTIPWYYRETCSNFKRLSLNNYLKNFKTVFSPNGIYHFEVLEGLEKGLSAGERPCHVCASVDYEIYRSCSSQSSFDIKAPCGKIAGELASYYKKQSGDSVNTVNF